MITDARTGKARVPRPILIVVIMPPHTTRLHVLTHSDAAIPIPSAVQHRRADLIPDRLSEQMFGACGGASNTP
ncbi:hypothetical protein [Mycobacterium riyadhense]|uniref:Uncharacterized protein n=1 Tax=Mycobacterium riyadhense TaxID=486698 RepID=A0A1X2DFR4_9MYCO|nr:hypothetical protein [Mycobacterium riyadhense]MCV7148001.1 hypothetical protein [Mycobacterium riyadhense]ORW86972.1 hypothetical protein AWC22_00835 [Mycobacterium riyadhense]